MKKPLYVILGIAFVSSCVGRESQVDKIMEAGVEVVLNHRQPYKLKSEPYALHLEEDLRINFGREEFAELGLRYPEFVDSDSEGNIYIGDSFRRGSRLIDKFDRTGRLIRSFGQRGQGPGELQYIYDLEIF